MTRTFNRLVDQAGVRRIRLHDVRHAYATLARDRGVNGKIVTDRLGHANESVTQQIYIQKSTGQDRAAAEMIAPAYRRSAGRRWGRFTSPSGHKTGHAGNENEPPGEFRRAVLPGSGGGI